MEDLNKALAELLETLTEYNEALSMVIEQGKETIARIEQSIKAAETNNNEQ